MIGCRLNHWKCIWNYKHIFAGALTFDIEYTRWLEEQNKQINELRTAVNAHASDSDLRLIVDGIMAHYDEIFKVKGVAAKADVFHILSGMWKTPAERCFLWLGGFRPSELLRWAKDSFSGFVLFSYFYALIGDRRLLIALYIYHSISAPSESPRAPNWAAIAGIDQPPAIFPAGRGCIVTGHGSAAAIIGRDFGWISWSIRFFRQCGKLHGSDGHGHGQTWDTWEFSSAGKHRLLILVGNMSAFNNQCGFRRPLICVMLVLFLLL